MNANLRLNELQVNPLPLNRRNTVPQITGRQILDALMQDSEYSAQPVSVREVMEPFMLAIPEVLKDHLDKTVTLATLMDAKIAFLRYCVANDFVKKVVGAMPEESFDWLDANSAASMMQGMMSQVVEMLAKVVKDAPAFLEAQGITEEEMMAHPKGVALRPDVFRLYKAGTLTIADVLKMQPTVIVKNSE